MAFDAKTFLESDPSNSLGGLGASFGLPSCMLGLAADVLGLIPAPILLAMRQAIEFAQALADAVIKRINSFIRDLLGISLFPDRDGFKGYFSEFSRFKMDVLSGIVGAIAGFAAFAQAIQQAAEELMGRYDQAVTCLAAFKKSLDFQNGNAGERRAELAALKPAGYDSMINSQFGVYFQQSQQAQQFSDECQDQLDVIDGILLERTLNPSLEPGDLPDEVVESVFRLEAGPPKSTLGKFVLSVDGLYYDSKTDGITPALLELDNRKKDLDLLDEGGFDNPDLWKLEYDPSLGGRGAPTTSDELQYYFNSILDPKLLDNSQALLNFYNADELLLSLEGQKDRKVFDVSSEIQELIEDGESQAVISNLRQVMMSETSHFQDKINKRKKQIELAVKVPNFLGNGPQFTPGNIPVNDFSYLAGSNFLLDIENQRSITIDQADVTGVVLPLEIKYTDKIETNDPVVLDHILLSNVAKGEIISNPSSPAAPTLHINDRISEDGLIALYNYLTVQSSLPSGTDFGVHNSSRLGGGYASQIVGSVSSVFDKGLGIPFLSGVALPSKDDNSVIGSMGSYVKIPSKNEFKDFLYNSRGASFETWVYVPNLDSVVAGWNINDNSTSGLYRLILSNENVGIAEGKDPQPDIDNLNLDSGTDVVRGLVYGFTRDRRFTQGLEPSNNDSDNSVENSVLVLAPTQSYDSSSAGFIANRTENCNKDSYYGMKIPVWQIINNKSLSSCGDSFCQLSVSLDPVEDKISVYLDGSLLSTSSYQGVFGTSKPGSTFKAPSVYQPNSFQYSAGPYLDPYFTPWIIGGGYTDGFSAGNFMGGEYGGKVSGLKGYVGCNRFYSKPLSGDEVLNNYKATKNFFKNISFRSDWEPVTSE